MKKLMLCLAMIAAMLGTGAQAQDFTGDWQGTLKITGSDIRMVMRVSRGDKSAWAVKLINADRATQPMNASSVTVDGTSFKFSVDLMGASFAGKLSTDGKSISGTWTQGQPVPLELVRATPQTAWEIPTPPAPPKPMAADADPSFEVATIKPNPSGDVTLRQLTINGRNFILRNGSLADMISFAYNVQKKQIVNAPDWEDKDRYDINAVPDVEGAPNLDQLRIMMRKLLADRYALKFHHEKREMAAFVLSAGKSEPKLTKSESTSTLPNNVGIRGAPNGIKAVLTNATTADFTVFLQLLVLDKPVVDQTGITGRYDISVTFTPDDSQFNGRPPKGPPLAEGTEPAPDLYSAIQQQLGMKLSPEKTSVDVIAIDHVEKPTPN